MSKAPNWESVESEALELFRGLLRIDTTNPPGDEIEAAEYLAEHLEEEGIDPWIDESAPGRGNLVARLPATVETPAEEPLLLAGHTDVVPAEPEAWTHPPFEAVRDEGCIWGRGAIDMKNMVAMSAMVLCLLDRLGVDRRRDVVFAAVADEERGCEYGSKYLVEEHPDRVRASTMLGEVGGFWQTIGGTTYVPVQVAEKGRAHLVMEAEGTGGHGSIPRRGEAVSRLARAVRRVDRRRLPYHLTEPVETFIRSLADHQGLANRIGLRGLLGATTAGTVIDHLLPDPAVARNFDALLHNTATPTVLRAGEELNVIPRRARCELDGRLLPGFDGDDLRGEVRDVVDDPKVDIEVREETSAVRTPFEEDEVLEVVEEVVGRHASDAVPVPYMIPGYTDAQHFRRLGAHCYGFAPIKIAPERDLVFSDLFHGVDERIPVEGFEWGLRVLFETVRALVEPPG